MPSKAPLSVLLLATTLTACTLGPNYAGPPPVGSNGAIPARFVRGDATAVASAPSLERWWTIFGDATLDELERRALAANPNLAIATARLRQARASLRLERANQLPSGSADTTYLHAETPDINIGQSNGSSGSGTTGSSSDRTPFNYYNLGFDASWEIDLFGGHRRTVEAERAGVAAAQANVADAQVSLTAEVAQDYVNLRDRQHRVVLSRQSAVLQRQMLALVQQRFDRGTATALDVERLRTQLNDTEAQAIPLAADLDSYRNALAVLTGVEPGAVDQLLAASAPVPLPPASVAIGDPTALLQRRPDIRAAERQLAANTARIGVQEAARFPRLRLIGLVGFGGTDPSDVIDLDKFTALAAPMVQWNFADFGRGRAKVEQARGARDEAEAQYRKTVLKALQDAEDALSRFGNRRLTVASLAQVKASADRAATLTRQRYRGGTATLSDSLDTEDRRVSAEQNLSNAMASLTGDYIALQKALGLGWTAAPGAEGHSYNGTGPSRAGG